ncbi:Ctr copper transporter family-domain-containing protein [Lasiosphaeria miniovina]|uniref:Copper transport protein n=1 Tax=Lasiosphaeria miniovina TaxID=1954250 RepID=A0AA40BI97_9PEZI|nr:Ctr copper transporter family-domain-containing protein [Lasiosphaeria miniovina]KAK0734725.1 Ctr copper transporter family-domain-containing protein [Lasiosphaeria miniovina]
MSAVQEIPRPEPSILPYRPTQCRNVENVYDTCFLSSHWHVTTAAIFAGTCIGVILLTLSLELLRFLARAWDRKIVERQGPNSQPNIWRQLVRAFLFTLQVINAYLLMMLAMYFNGFIFLCIILGSFISFFLFRWDPFPGRAAAQHVDIEEGTSFCDDTSYDKE